METISWGLLIAIVFIAGFGWGQWHAERSIRAERTVLEKGRVTVSMPMNPDDAAATMELLKNLIEQVDRDKLENRMSEKTVITCDAMSCCNEYEHIGGDFMIMDIIDKGWLYVPEHETHYCRSCKAEVKKELDNDDVEYIS